MARIYRIVFRDIVKAVGGDAAYLLAELIACERFAKKNETASADGWFTVSEKLIEEYTGFERTKQYRELAKLNKHGFISIRNKNGVGREFKITAEPARKRAGNPRENEQGTRANMRGYPRENAQVFIYMNSLKNSSLNSSCIDEQQQQIYESIFSYFSEQIPDAKKAYLEAAAFIQYNRENYGPEHLTAKNYKRHANAWIKAAKHPPKKKASSGRGGKTAAEVAESQGVTVTELMGGEETDTAAEPGPADDDFINDIFGG